MSRHLSPAQVELLDNFDAGNMGEVEFFELAMEMGLPLRRIERAMREARSDEDGLP